ncbi:hypothetical protein [Cesiribacter sp. SM1]|uniref:hypothetical protein n=1 Tax=Cesiribacter sp. SM1 TaxID=2861196 RepID=UPI001CD5F3FC|nr:hypothetical protein [Cesiribacter sp. SM1]
MKQKKSSAVEIEVDRLTNSIENSFTGEVFDTAVIQLKQSDNKLVKGTEWVFDWLTEIKDSSKEIYKLTTINNPKIIHGLLSIEDKADHIFIHLIESSNFNKGANKVYVGVAGNLFAFACKLSFDRGYDGYVAFDSKTSLIKHYEKTIGATHFRGKRMFIDTPSAEKLVQRYFKTK